jgi:hypothetical protein
MAPYSGDERRLACRYSLDTPIEYSIADPAQGNRIAAGWGLDISETGISFLPAEPLPEGLEIQLSVPWPWAPGMAGLRLAVTGRILRSDDIRCALEIRCYNFQVVPEDSLTTV